MRKPKPLGKRTLRKIEEFFYHEWPLIDYSVVCKAARKFGNEVIWRYYFDEKAKYKW